MASLFNKVDLLQITYAFHFRKKLSHYFYLLLLFVSLPAFSQNADIASYLPSGCYHAGQYEQKKTVEGIDKDLNTKGTFLFNCDQGLIWNTNNPINETLIYKIQGNHSIINADGSVKTLEGRIHRELGKLLNNLIGGNAEYLHQNFTSMPFSIDHIDKEPEKGLELTPKSKQMQKFLRGLQIRQGKESVSITLYLGEKETTYIRIFGRQQFTEMNAAQCLDITKLSAACDALFKGAK